jgi:hypothetical protein
MSHKGRKRSDGSGGVSVKHDIYLTPNALIHYWLTYTKMHCIQRAKHSLARLDCLEPCANSGNIIRAFNNHWTKEEIIYQRSKKVKPVIVPGYDFPGNPPKWATVELQDIFPDQDLIDDPRYGIESMRVEQDFLTFWPNRTYDLILTNPPFTLFKQFAEHSMNMADDVVFILRLGALGSNERREFWHLHSGAIEIVPWRPSFTVDGGTDQDTYMFISFKEKNSWRVL